MVSSHRVCWYELMVHGKDSAASSIYPLSSDLRERGTFSSVGLLVELHKVGSTDMSGDNRSLTQVLAQPSSIAWTPLKHAL